RSAEERLLVAERLQRGGEVVVALATDDTEDLDAIRPREAAALRRCVDEHLARTARQVDDATAADLAARQRRAVAHEDAVVARSDRDAHRRTLGLVRLGDHRLRALVLDERLALERRRQLDVGGRGA